MDITITPGQLSGEITVIPSKSQAHRILICAAFADRDTRILCDQTSRDMDATADCLRALGTEITQHSWGYWVHPASSYPVKATLPCHDSGSTLRFMLPVAAALGIEATFILEGRLSQRPLSPLWEEMQRMGCTLSRPTKDTVLTKGRLKPGSYFIDGGVSSQFITGLMLALPLLGQSSAIHILGKLESKPYVDMTVNALKQFGVFASADNIPGIRSYQSPVEITIEGDWSNGAFFLTAKQLGSNLRIFNLSDDSFQGDREIKPLLSKLKQNIVIPVEDIPDLVPILSVFAACNNGCTFTGIRRLRMKESDRVSSVIRMLQSLGIHAEADEDRLTVYPGSFTGGTVDSVNDHRIAMSAAIAATVCQGPVIVQGAECVSKSYPCFWEEYRRLGGIYEQHLR